LAIGAWTSSYETLHRGFLKFGSILAADLRPACGGLVSLNAFGTFVDFVTDIDQPPSSPSLAVDCILQPLPRLELRLPGGGNLDRFSGTGIPTLAGCTFGDSEAAEPGQSNIVTIFQSLANDIKGSIDSIGCLGSGDAGGFGDNGDKIGFVHQGPPCKVSNGNSWEFRLGRIEQVKQPDDRRFSGGDKCGWWSL